MNLIDAKEFHERKSNLYRLYGRQLPYYLSIPHGWLSTVEEMFAMLEMSIKPSSFRKMWFVELVKKEKPRNSIGYHGIKSIAQTIVVPLKL